MNKASLKASWGEYCDTDKLVDDVMALLTKYHHRNSEHGVCKMLNEYFTNKQTLIQMFKKSPHYIGDMRICIDEEIERYSNRDEVFTFCRKFSDKVGAKKAILKYKDDDGKTFGDYVRVGFGHISAKDLLVEDNAKKLIVNNEKKANFMDDGSTKKSSLDYSAFTMAIDNMSMIYSSTIGEGSAATINHGRDYKVVDGMKTARAFNRICAYYKIDKCADYNKLFAQYADMVSGLNRKIKFFISVNPMDYLTMSFGVSWASCHTIDKGNVRSMPHAYSGQYCGGTMSYMLDNTSIITFVNDHIPTNWEDGKIYRCMFHYGNDILVQSRVYPQGNDGNTDLYSVFRGFVQKELAMMLGVENRWVKRKNGTRDNISSHGTHYRDYAYNNECNETYLKALGDAPAGMIEIGHEGICPYCGKTFTNSSRLSHADCEIPTQYVIDPDSGAWINVETIDGRVFNF